MRSVFVIAAIAATLSAPSMSFAQTPQAAAFEVSRSGDDQLSCEALTAEVGALNGQIQQAQAAATPEKPRRRFGGLGAAFNAAGGLGTLGGVAAAFIPGASLAIGAAQLMATAEPLIDQAEETARAEAAAQAAAAPQPVPTVDAGLLQQRVNHLTGLSQGRPC